MQTQGITGAGGINLNVHETGPAKGKPILFIHGFSQCGLAWIKQLNSELAQEFRLVAMDVRGHGQSDKPRDAYGDSKLWADDVRAVITALGLEAPVLCGWSYGGVVMSDYLARYGERDIAGTHWVSTITRLGKPLAERGFLGANFLEVVPALCADDAPDGGEAMQTFLRLCMHEAPALEDLYFFLGYNGLVPAHVRRSLLARDLNNDAAVATSRKPMLISYGERDRIVTPAMARHVAQLTPHARVSAYPGVGHMPFWEAPERFNRELAEFRAAA